MGDPVVEQTRQPIVITKDQFSIKPLRHIDHDGIGPVNRGNFTSILVDSFSVSRGIPNRHLLYFEWLKAHTGFDYRQSLQNFLDAGGYECLSPEEKEFFKNSFVAVGKHKTSEKGGLLAAFQKNPAEEIKNQLEILTVDFDRHFENANKLIEKYGPLANLSKTDLVKKLDESVSEK